MFYLIAIPIAVVLLAEMRYLLKVRKHDQVLFPICELRGDLMRFLLKQEEAGLLNRADYLYARLMLGSMNHTVSLYRDHRTRLFNLRNLVRFLNQYRVSARELIAVPRTESPELRAIEARFNQAMMKGFFAYTPLLRTELRAHLALAIMAFFAKMGIGFFARRLRETQEVLDAIREQGRLAANPTGLRLA